MACEEHDPIDAVPAVIGDEWHFLAVVEPEGSYEVAPIIEEGQFEVAPACRPDRWVFLPSGRDGIEARALRVELDLDIPLQIHGREVYGEVDFLQLRDLFEEREREQLEIVGIDVGHRE